MADMRHKIRVEHHQRTAYALRVSAHGANSMLRLRNLAGQGKAGQGRAGQGGAGQGGAGQGGAGQGGAGHGRACFTLLTSACGSRSYSPSSLADKVAVR